MSLYSVLDVPKTADLLTIQRAYRRLAKETHPDRNGNDPNATRRFYEVTEAYRTLSDPGRRRQYDRGSECAESIVDLLRRRPAGRRLLDTTLPKARLEERRGNDVLLAIPVPRGTFASRKTFDVTLPAGHEPPRVSLTAPASFAGAHEGWVTLARSGQPGTNSGPNGNLLIYIYEEE